MKSNSLLHSLTNVASPVLLECAHESINEANILSSLSSSSPPVLLECAHESINEANILCSPSSTYSSINICSGWSTEDEHEEINYKWNLDSDYTSENSFLHPLVNFKSKHWKAQNAKTNVSDWKPECEYTVNDLKCINSNNNQRYSIQKLSSILAESLHDEAESSEDLTSWYKLKYTRTTQTVTISTKPYGLPQSALKDQIFSAAQPVTSDTQCSPSDVNSLYQE
jgi:hypothetical protein